MSCIVRVNSAPFSVTNRQIMFGKSASYYKICVISHTLTLSLSLSLSHTHNNRSAHSTHIQHQKMTKKILHHKV
jgi:hypothetical protein